MPILFRHYGRHRNVPTAHFGAGDIEVIACRTEPGGADSYVVLRECEPADPLATGQAAKSTDGMKNIDMVLCFDTVDSIDVMLRTLRNVRKSMENARQRAKSN